MILLDDHMVIFDCLEFNDALRWIDVASEVAFLTMDLEDRGRPDLAHRFLTSYLEATGDYGLLVPLPFYLTYRAIVRAKVAGIRLGQSALAPEGQQVREAFTAISIWRNGIHPVSSPAVDHHGLSGSGKTGPPKVVEARRRAPPLLLGNGSLASPSGRSTGRTFDLYARIGGLYASGAKRARVVGLGSGVRDEALQRTHRDAFRSLR
jgi:hypothetical protein